MWEQRVGGEGNETSMSHITYTPGRSSSTHHLIINHMIKGETQHVVPVSPCSRVIYIYIYISQSTTFHYCTVILDHLMSMDKCSGEYNSWVLISEERTLYLLSNAGSLECLWFAYSVKHGHIVPGFKTHRSFLLHRKNCLNQDYFLFNKWI